MIRVQKPYFIIFVIEIVDNIEHLPADKTIIRIDINDNIPLLAVLLYRLYFIS